MAYIRELLVYIMQHKRERNICVPEINMLLLKQKDSILFKEPSFPCFNPHILFLFL